MDWHPTLDSLRAAVTSGPLAIRRLWGRTPGKQAALIRQAEEMLLADWTKENEGRRSFLANAMRYAKKPHLARLLEEPRSKKPHLARLLEEPRSPALRYGLLSDSGEPEPLPQEPRLLQALGVWSMHRPLDEPPGPRRVLDLARNLRRNGKAHIARRLLRERLWQGQRFPLEMRSEICVELALCTSMASDLAPESRFDRALELLDSLWAGVPLPPQKSKVWPWWRCRAWISRQRWELYGQEEDLDGAAEWYRVACRESRDTDTTDHLRNAADAAYYTARAGDYERAELICLEALRKATSEGERTDPPDEVARDPLLHYRWLVSLAQLQIGLLSFDGTLEEKYQWLRGLPQPLDLLTEAGKLGREVPAWMHTRKVREITERVVDDVYLGALLDGQDSDRPPVRRSLARGKVGLGLSGGGFRASLFHLGVLANLAERDLLKRVEVFSCVSGGSIVGAHFYLKLRHLLTEKPDAEIEPEDYIDLVRELIHEFLAGVQKNVRTRVVANPLANLRMLLTRYTRSSRAGDLMDRHFFRRVRGRRADENAYWQLSELRVQPMGPKGQETDFNPELDNWTREHKLPILTLNATSLNTGHSWQFAATWMGESPSAIEPAVDSNDRLRRMKVEEEAPPPHGQTRLGQAVAASACVPGLFEPSTLQRLYPGKLVRLVDGGVFDNQGVAGLMEQGCRIVVVSDASGQMEAQDRPHGGLLGSLLRTNTILMDRIRQTQYQDLRARARSGQLDGLFYVHLKQDLEADAINWLGCADPKPSERTDETPTYGIPKATQALLAGIRTDLDSFCDAEAYALMYSGYQMMSLMSLDQVVTGPRRMAGCADWPFLCIEQRLRQALEEPGSGGAETAQELERRRRLKNILTVAGKGALKIWCLWRRSQSVAKWVSGALALLPLAWLSWLYLSWLRESWKIGDETSLSVSIPALGLVSLAVVALFRVPPLRAAFGRTLNFLVFGILGMVAAWVHLAVFDRLYLHYGREPGGFARRLLHEGKTARAMADLEHLAKNPRDWLAQVGLARALDKLGRPEEAKKKHVAALKEIQRELDEVNEQRRRRGHENDRESLLGRRAHQLTRRGLYVVRLAIRLDPEDAELLRSSGALLNELESEEALVDYNRAIELDPENAMCFQGRGDSWKVMVRYQEALEDYTRAIELDPENAEHLRSRGALRYEAEDYEKALADYTRAIELDPENAVCFQGRGDSLKVISRYEEALEDYTRAIELDPENAEFFRGRASVFEKLGRDEEAQTDHSRALELAKLGRDEDALLDENRAKEET